MPVLTWIDTTWCMLLTYFAAVGATLGLGLAESGCRRAHRADHPDLWPRFWYATASLLFVMTLGRVSDSGDLLSNFGRAQARSQGWYETRRNAQALVVGTLAALWGVSVITAIWRVPERRRRYLPTAVVIVTLVCFVGARMVSFHPVDSLLYNTEFVGVRMTALIETSVVFTVVLTTAWNLRSLLRPPADRPSVA